MIASRPPPLGAPPGRDGLAPHSGATSRAARPHARAGALLLLVLASCARDPGPGQVAPGDPEQVALADAAPMRHEGYEILPLATYSLDARVLSVETYRFDRNADLSRLDLALGWGPMSDGEILRHFKIRQAFRTFSWTTRQFPIPREDVEAHAANVHVIAPDRSTERALRRLREGDVVRLKGMLVEARASDGWSWRSSLSRTDTGMGSCELFWVESVQVR